jgi:hypothetical protein
MTKISLLLFIPFLVACEQQYRYACQNMENWDKEECKKPRCEVHRECPEHIFSNGTSKAVLDYISAKENLQTTTSAPKKGECK